MVQQQPRNLVICLHRASISLRYYASEKRRVSAESVGIDGGFCVDVRAMRNQPAHDFNFVVVNGNVQQRGAGQWRTVQRQRLVGMASEFRWVNFLVGKSAGNKLRIAQK